jgi:hypothetical protein
MAEPGKARVTGLGQLPVAVDVQVRRATEQLGVTQTHGLPLDEARPIIQRAWAEIVADGGAAGPDSVADTCAALDPALWFLGKWGCSECEKRSHRLPVMPACSGCRLDAGGRRAVDRTRA